MAATIVSSSPPSENLQGVLGYTRSVIVYNRYVELLPNSSHAYWHTAWKVFSIAILVAYMVIAIAAVLFTGLYIPNYLPVAMVTAYHFTPFAYELYTYCAQLGEREKQLATVEEGVLAELRGLSMRDTDICHLLSSLGVERSHIQGTIHPLYWGRECARFRPLIARYLYWREKSHALKLQAEATIQRVPSADQMLRRAEYQKAYALRVEAQMAKIQAAYFRGILLNPTRQEEMQTLFHLNLHDDDYNLITGGLNAATPGGSLDESLLLIHHSRENWTMPQVEKADIQDICLALFPTSR